ncbi:MAG TPA: hypothetical protein VD905_19025 [Flavobacteriales bacterium]|nr:hypothetical protein [Flavobacteriales bacterium]
MHGTSPTNNLERTFKATYILLCVALLIECNSSKTNEEKSQAPGGEFTKHVLHPHYALGFTVYENETTIRLTSRNPHDTTEVYKVLDFKKTDLPFKKIAITSTTHSFLFDAIGSSTSIAGMSAMVYLQDSSLKAVYEKNGVVELGKDDNLNREIIIKLNPQVLMVYPCNGCDYSDYEKAGIVVVNNAEYLEEHPLGRAEWVKVAGLLAGKQEAISFFDSIARNYQNVKKQGQRMYESITKSGTIPRFNVILGKPIDNIWHVPGNKSFAAKLVEDASGYYEFEEIEGNNVKAQSMEWIVSNSLKSKYWIFTDYSTNEITLNTLKRENKVFGYLNPVKLQNVICCNSAKDDFFGKAVIQPDVLLSDLVFHFWNTPAGYKPVYFKKLKEK